MQFNSTAKYKIAAKKEEDEKNEAISEKKKKHCAVIITYLISVQIALHVQNFDYNEHYDITDDG